MGRRSRGQARPPTIALNGWRPVWEECPARQDVQRGRVPGFVDCGLLLSGRRTAATFQAGRGTRSKDALQYVQADVVTCSRVDDGPVRRFLVGCHFTRRMN